jgi:tripartite-type tricarboxylate transporter receptor subunit TctC
MITAYCLDLDARVVTGYKGGAEADLSVRQLETDASGTVTGSFLRNEKGGLIRGIFAIDTRRVAGVSHIPALTELVKLPKEKMDLLESSLALRPSKATFITPGVPKDRLTFLQEAYWQALKQEGFRKDITKLLGYSDIVFLSGEEALTTAKTAKANKKPWQERLRFLFEKYRAGL